MAQQTKINRQGAKSARIRELRQNQVASSEHRGISQSTIVT